MAGQQACVLGWGEVGSGHLASGQDMCSHLLLIPASFVLVPQSPMTASNGLLPLHGQGIPTMQATGALILEQLAAQRQQITHAQATVQSADQNLDKSRQILKRMSSWWSW